MVFAKDKNQIFVYNGPGTSKDSIEKTIQLLKANLVSFYKVTEISPKMLLTSNWPDNTALLVIPGGADIPYTKVLNGKGNKRIITYVKQGGAFLAICAGGYYGGSFVEFSLNTAIEVTGARELKFFPGIVRGPLFPYYYNSNKGAKILNINWKAAEINNRKFKVYYNGGGYFVNAEYYPTVKVLAVYDKEKYPAIVECQVNKGKAILSGVHFEYNSPLAINDNYHKNLAVALARSEKDRMVLVKVILTRLKLKVKKPDYAL